MAAVMEEIKISIKRPSVAMVTGRRARVIVNSSHGHRGLVGDFRYGLMYWPDIFLLEFDISKDS